MHETRTGTKNKTKGKDTKEIKQDRGDSALLSKEKTIT